MGEFYYESCDSYDDISHTTELLAYSTNTWTLCDIPTDTQILEDNQRMAYQGMLDRCSDLNGFETDIEEAQLLLLLKPSIRPPATDD